MRKVGILTLYYNNRNYGGLLQAYALTRTINEIGFPCEQICRKFGNVGGSGKRRIKIRNIIKYTRTLVNLLKNRFYAKITRKRDAAMYRFRDIIPHSKTVYRSCEMEACLKDYDVFITGSDQVWNMDWYRKEYFLDFVPENITKLSYAASMPNVYITDEQKEIVKQHLESFDAISVREEETTKFLRKLTGKDVVQVLDPTLLLDKLQWDDICSNRIIEGDYIFCYFLGTEKAGRKQAKRFAKKLNYKIVTLPHLVEFCKNDLFFADVNLYDISPKQFISLIKHAKYVITDSFHAAVFSTIYKTKYFVFDRTDIGKMSGRITTLLSLTGNEFRFCHGNKADFEYMLENKDKPVTDTTEGFIKMKNDSIEFLKNILKK